VLLSHAFELVDGNRGRELLTQVFHTLSFGELAVDGFFIISGYLILQSWLHGPEIVGFLRKRILRIYPAFIVAVIVSVLVFGPYATTSKFYFHLLDHEALLRSTIRLMPPEVPRPFTKMHYPLLNGAMWTIAYEFRCYVLVALLGLLGLANRAWVWLGIGAVSLALFTVLPTGTQLRLPWSELLIGDPVPAVRFISLFCSGALLFLWREKLPVSPIVVVGAGLVLVAGMFSPILAPIVLCSAGAYLLWVFAFAEIPPLRFFQTAPDISYGTYLYGWPIEELLIQYHPDWTPWVVFVAATALCYALGWVSWTFIEKPALRFKAA
jgi:peptidoglycan/LPS O-acetylase OafA/YrhL